MPAQSLYKERWRDPGPRIVPVHASRSALHRGVCELGLLGSLYIKREVVSLEFERLNMKLDSLIAVDSEIP